MSKFYHVSGVTAYQPRLQQLLHERTRNWFIRFDRPSTSAPLDVRVYATQSDAVAGNAAYSGVKSIALTDSRPYITLAAGPQAPSLSGASILVEIPSPAAATGTAIWRCDLGKKFRRAQLWVLRSFSKISTANGYFTDFARIERGFMTWDEAKKQNILPYLGVGMVSARSTTAVIGGAQQGTLHTTLEIRCIAHDETFLGPGGITDPDTDYILHDLRRVLSLQFDSEVWSGLQDDHVPIMSYDFLMSEPDLGMNWARGQGFLEFVVQLVIEEQGQTEIRTT